MVLSFFAVLDWIVFLCSSVRLFIMPNVIMVLVSSRYWKARTNNMTLLDTRFVQVED